MDDPYYKYSNSTSPTQKQMDKADKEAMKLAVKEKIAAEKAAEKAERERVAAEEKLKAAKLKNPENYSDSDDDVGLSLSHQKIEPGVKIDETYWAESSVEPPPIGPRLFDDKIGPVYPSYIGKDGKVRADDVAPPNWLKEQSGANKSKRRRKSNRRVVTRRKSKRGRTTKSKRGIKSKRTRS